MTFQKGHKINVGRVCSEETKRKLSESHKGIKNTWSDGSSFRGKKHTEEWKIMMGKKMKGRVLTEKQKVALATNRRVFLKGQPSWNKGLTKETDERVRAYAEKISGSNSPNWRGGVSPAHKSIRKSPKYKQWRTDVFERDDYTCQDCRQRGGRLHPHHVKPFADFVELRFEPSNGLTLCEACHRKTDTYGFGMIHKKAS